MPSAETSVHAVAAAGDQDRAERVAVDERPAGGDDGVVALQALACSMGELGAVRRQHRGAGVAPIVAALGIDHHRAARAVGGLDQAPQQVRREDPLGVVGEDHRVRGRERVPCEADQAVGRAGRDRLGRLRIGAEQLLRAGDEARLLGGLAPAFHQQVGLDPFLAPDHAGEPAPHLVVPDHGEQRRVRAQRDEIAHHIAGAAQHVDIAVGAQDRHRRLGRGALDPPVDEAVQHHVADAGDAAGAERFDMGSEG